MFVIGTAGHIDHGKSTLIRALTGIDPDRLKEEKERGMTIDLGFAWLTLPSGREVGIVDVPGHHRFIRNMLAGVTRIGLTLLVVAADEGWMPQTAEHVAILDLLGVRRGVVVLTKKDLVEPEWLELVAADVRERLAGTTLAEAPVVAVSSTTGEGLDKLVQTIDRLLAGVPEAADLDRARLWIDRVFTIRGAGTVVTGTLEGGALAVDTPVEILPGGLASRVRGLQTHKRPVTRALPGHRVAVNLAGVQKEELARGQAVVQPGRFRPTSVVNVWLRASRDLSFVLPERCELQFYAGTAELAARCRLLDRTELGPGETALAQIELEGALPLQFGDRFILRDPARQETVGGGEVLDAFAVPVRGRSLRLVGGGGRTLRLDLLRARIGAESRALPALIVADRGVVPLDTLTVEVPLPAEHTLSICREEAAAGRFVLLPSYAVSHEAWEQLVADLRRELAAYHARYPLRFGLARETLRTRLRLEARLFDEAVEELTRRGQLVARGALVALPEHRVVLSPEQEREAARLLALLRSQPYAPPEWDALEKEHRFDPELLSALAERGDVVRINREIVMAADVFEEVKARVAAHIAAHGSIDVGQLRDMLGTSRKYAVPLLEYLDEVGFTRRVGDVRVLVGAASSSGRREEPGPVAAGEIPPAAGDDGGR